MRIILHIDFDSFFASVEQQFSPSLRGKPLGVTARNGSPSGACIIASSREAKQLGIGTGTRAYEAKKLCPSVSLVRADFVKYSEVSKKFIKICDEFSPIVEIFSIDEVFMDVTQTAVLFGGVYTLIEKFKARLREELGEYITASVGISHNKLLAKLASGLKKPNGAMEITPSDIALVYQHAKLTDICGIGGRTAKRLNSLGIYNLVHLRRTTLASLVAEFGNVEGRFLSNVANGLDHSPVVPYADADEVKSVGRQYCLPHNEYDQRKVLQNVYELCEEVGLRLRKLGKKARTVGIYLGGEPSISGRHTSARYLDSGREIFEGITSITGTTGTTGFFARDTRDTRGTRGTFGFVRRISIWTGNLVDARRVPSSLLPLDQKQQKVIQAVDKINEKFGHHTIRNGFLLYADKLTTVPNGYSRNI